MDRFINCDCSGHMTITLGRKYDPARIVGLDIDRKLVEIARKNIRHYMDTRCEEYNTNYRYLTCTKIFRGYYRLARETNRNVVQVSRALRTLLTSSLTLKCFYVYSNFLVLIIQSEL